MYEKLLDRWRELEANGYEPHACWREIQKEFPQEAEAFLQARTNELISDIEKHLTGT